MFNNIKKLFLLSVIGIVSNSLQAKNINFFAIADPQFGWSDESGTARAENTMRDVAILAAKCLDCVKAIPIAGDLTMDGDGRTPYGNAHKSMERYAIKVLDGLGNHDSEDLADDETSFDSYDELHDGENLALRGWEIFDQWQAPIDGGDCSFFNKEPKHYCRNSDAYYYTVSLSNGSDIESAYLIQLHNAIGSENTLRYLERIKNKVDHDLPIIIVGHSFNGLSSPANRRKFYDLIRRLNVVSILHGHYHCTNEGDHCDYEENSPGFVIDSIDYPLENKYGSQVALVNMNAAFHNIFWSISLDVVNKKIAFKRYNRGHLSRPEDYDAHWFDGIVNQIGEKSAEAYNQPYKSESALICDYSGKTKKSCIEQIRSGNIIPSKTYRGRAETDGYWGGWGNISNCSSGEFVFGYRLRSEKYKEDNDDTALNDVELYCAKKNSNEYAKIYSKYSQWGDWSPEIFCSGGDNPVKGFFMKIEPKQGDGDDTSANNIKLTCMDGSVISSGANTDWGDWTSQYTCPYNQAVTGIITRVDDPKGSGDDTALNGVRLICSDYHSSL